LEKPSLYLESSIFSYLLNNPNPNLVIAARQLLTHQWWSMARQKYAVFISQPVIDEISEGDITEKEKRFNFVDTLVTNHEITVLKMSREITELAELYYQKLNLPADAKNDATHFAIAVYYQIEYFLTWNLKHFARRERVEEIRRLNEKLKSHHPFIVTPEDLLPE
jgi:predicted nucleic acid-binding protein